VWFGPIIEAEQGPIIEAEQEQGFDERGEEDDDKHYQDRKILERV